MKLTNILLLIFALGVGSSIYAQVKPTPSVSPTPVQSSDIMRTVFKARTTRVTGISAQTQKDLEIASKLMQDGEHEKSVAAHTNIIKTNPNIMIAYNNRGFSYLQLGKLDSAITDFTTALKISPTSLTYNNRGMAYSKKAI